MKLASLPKLFLPQLITLKLDPITEMLIKEAEVELRQFASIDKNKCWGYFPALAEKNINLNKSKKLHEQLPVIEHAGLKLDMNFVRLSLIQQTGDSPYHMDSDSKTALTGDTTTIGSRLVWRLLLNLSDKNDRNLGYLNLDTEKLTVATDGGYIHYTGDTMPYENSITIPPRQTGQVSAVLFCASRVLHTGKDDLNGHFVAGYGCEETA